MANSLISSKQKAGIRKDILTSVSYNRWKAPFIFLRVYLQYMTKAETSLNVIIVQMLIENVSRERKALL